MTEVWTKICDSDMTVPKTGLYVFACRCDNHVALELYRLNEKEKLWKYFTEEFVHFDGYFRVIPFAYHYIDYYSDKSSSHWETPKNFVEEWEYSYIWAYLGNESKIEYALQSFDSSNIYPECAFLNIDSKTCYDKEYWENTNFVGYYKFLPYI